MTDEPMLRVLRGEPTPEELAALVALLTARAAGAERPARPVAAWADRARLVRRPLRPGTGAWRRSRLPQ